MTESRVEGLLPTDGSPAQAKAWKGEIADEMGVSPRTADKRAADAVEDGIVLRFAGLDARGREGIFYALALGRTTARAFYTPRGDGVYIGSLSPDMRAWLPVLVGQSESILRCPNCGCDFRLR